MKETVYFAYNPCVVPHEKRLRNKNTLWKIGKTKFENPEARLWQQDWTFLPMAHEIVFAIRGPSGTEKKVHNALDSLGWRYSFEGGGLEHFCIPNEFEMQKFIDQFINYRTRYITWPKTGGDAWTPRS